MEDESKRGIYTIILVVGMLAAGSATTILNKLQDLVCVDDCDKPVDDRIYYEEPLWQTLQMFVGEFFCWLIFLINERRTVSVAAVEEEKTNLLHSDSADTWEGGDAMDDDANTVLMKKPLVGHRNFLLAIPTICDLIATTLMNVGLIFVSASIYQMLRGAVVIFTAILSVIFLKTKLNGSKIYALVMILIGITVVGFSSVYFSGKEVKSKGGIEKGILGVGMILLAQCFTAAQFVIEEKIISNFSATPMKLVGLEGVFGMVFVLAGMGSLHLIFGLNDPKSVFNVIRGWNNFSSSPQIWVNSIVFAFCVGAFNWFGLNVTKYISSASRSTIDTCRTLFIWGIGMIIGLETFIWVELVGFVVLIYGTFVFNQVITPFPCFRKKRAVALVDTTTSQ